MGGAGPIGTITGTPAQAERAPGPGADMARAEGVRSSTHDPRLLEAGAALSGNRIPEAEALLRRHLRQHPTDVAAIRMLAEVALRLGRNVDAGNLLARCLELAPDFAVARYNYAVALHRQARSAEVLREIEQALAAEPRNPGYRSLYAVILERIGEFDRVNEVYAGVLAEHPQQPKDRPRVLGGIAYDALVRLARDRLSRTGGGHLLEATLESIPLRLDLPLRGEGADADRFAETVIAAVDGFLDDAVQHAAAFRPGHAFCLRGGASDCEHSAVPSARHVFLGYSPTGIPRWLDFAQACLDRRMEEVDRLFEDPPAFVTWLDPPGLLEGKVVRAFRGEGRFELLGQVVAGFYPLRTREGEVAYVGEEGVVAPLTDVVQGLSAQTAKQERE